MATYYINADNDIGIFPYNTPSYGVPNFNTLLSSVSIVDGDIIIVTSESGAHVGDSASTINIYNKVSILSEDPTPPKIKLPSNSMGINLHMDGISISNLSLYSDAYSGNVLLNINGSNSTTVSNCDFGYNAGSISGIVSNINVYNCEGVYLNGNTITLPMMDISKSYGIYLQNSSYCNVDSNTIKMVKSWGYGVIGSGVCNYNDIGFNVIGVFSEDDAVDTLIKSGIEMPQDGNNNTIHHNAIGLAGSSSTGILHPSNITQDVNITITNNYIHMYENDFGSTGVYTPINIDRVLTTYVTIINNIIEYTGNNNNGIAINSKIKKGVVDYNDIYNLNISNMFIGGVGDDWIKLGKYNVFSNPRLFWSQSPKSDQYDIMNFYCYKNSECIGSGYLHHHIGIGVDPSITATIDNYINVVDCVTDNYGFGTANGLAYNTFFNSVFTESSTQFDNYYRYTSDFPYTNNSEDESSNYPSYLDVSLGVYRNQFDFELTIPTTFPFSVGDHFYNKDMVYVFTNKDKLKPFDGILCPPNPGYGYPDYKGYEEGLWGYLRVNTPNTCSIDGCIIQDTISSKAIGYQDTISNVNIWTQDMILPPCITNS
jgi:hypothetical protein